MSNVNANSFVGQIKRIRLRTGSLPLSEAGSRLLRGIILELCDTILLNAGDEHKEEVVPTPGLDYGYGPTPGSSQHNPLDMSAGVRFMPAAPIQISPSLDSVRMVPAGGEPVHERPEIIQRPEGQGPDVFIIAEEAMKNHNLPPTLIVGPSDSAPPAPVTGSVEILDHALPVLQPGG